MPGPLQGVKVIEMAGIGPARNPAQDALARGSFAHVAGAYQPVPTPRFSRTVSELPGAPRASREVADEILQQAGIDAAAIDALRCSGVVQP